jgi:hypothetical protein
MLSQEGFQILSLVVSTHCENSLENALQSAERVLSLAQNIVVHLNRIEEDGKSRRNSKFCFLPAFDFGSVLLGEKQIYEASAVICHQGSAVSGHHIVFVKQGFNWKKMQ